MQLSVIADGVTYPLDDGVYAWWMEHDGLGMSPLHRLSEQGPLQHGDTDRGYRLDPRIIRLVLQLDKTTLPDLEAARQVLIDIFKPSPSPLTITLTGATVTYCLSCNYISQMTMPSADKDGYSQTVVVELKANDPTFYNSLISTVEFGGGGGSGMVVPVHLSDASGLFFGSSVMDAIIPITMNCTADDYPEITIVGPIEDPIIENLNYAEKLDFTGYHLAGGATIVIDLRYGYKTVVLQPSTNLIDKLTDDSDLTSWRLRPGVNDIQCYGTGITSATKIRIKYRERYLGV